jgi:ATP-dependent Clp protease ATP-binding subunit ClpA
LFERFTERARQVVVLAQDEARAFKHNYIDTEHILLGLLREEEGLGGRVLESFGITVEEVRAQVARIVGQGDEVTMGQIPFTPRAKKVLELSLREALSLGHNYIGTEHILLGLVRENEGVAARILLDFDADAEKIRNEIIRMLSGPGRRSQVPERAEASSNVVGRFTGQGRFAVAYAEDEARALNHNHIGTEHILLGLLREQSGLAARALASLDITVEEVRVQVARIVGQGDEVTSGQIPFTPRTKTVLQLALREALSLGHNYIGTEHILLGLVRENGGVAARILVDLGADPEQVQHEVDQVIGHQSGAGERAWLRGPRRRRWEYRVERWPVTSAAERLEELDRLGARGWQLAAALSDAGALELIFQRERRALFQPTIRTSRAAQRPSPAAPATETVVAAGSTAKELAQSFGVPLNVVIEALMRTRHPKTATEPLGDHEVELVAAVLDIRVRIRQAADPQTR